MKFSQDYMLEPVEEFPPNNEPQASTPMASPARARSLPRTPTTRLSTRKRHLG